MMCKFDSHKQELVRDIDTQTQNLFSNFEGMSLQEREEAINKIHDSFDKTDKCSDDKMQLSTKSYEIVSTIFNVLIFFLQRLNFNEIYSTIRKFINYHL